MKKRRRENRNSDSSANLKKPTGRTSRNFAWEEDPQDGDESLQLAAIASFFDAIAAGEVDTAGGWLRQIHYLGQTDLKSLADVLQGKADRTLFPFRFLLKQWKRGKASDPLKMAAEAFRTRREISILQQGPFAKLEAAVEKHAENIKASKHKGRGSSRSTIFRRLKSKLAK